MHRSPSLSALQLDQFPTIFYFLLVSVLNSDYRSPGHVSISGFDRLETGDVTFSVSRLVLLFSSVSAFKNELLSASPFHKNVA